MKPEQTLNRTNSNCKSSRKILPSNYTNSSSSLTQTQNSLQPKPSNLSLSDSNINSNSNSNKPKTLTTTIKSLLTIVSLPTFLASCRWLSLPSRLSPSSPPTLGRKITGTLFGHKKGHVSFAVQEDSRSDPVLLLELATSTCNLVKEMSSGLVRIALECKMGSGGTRPVKLFQEPMWTMYCNGKKCGYAVSRTCGESDWHVLSTVQTVSVGAGVIPVDKNRIGNGSGEGGEIMYMRARFERVVGNRDSEAFYMMNPDGSGGPDLSIFLLRI